MLGILEADPLLINLRLRLMFHALPYKKLQQQIFSLCPLFHADAFVRTEELVTSLSHRFNSVRLAQLERLLAESRDEKLRRLGLSALMARAASTKRWTDELRARLVEYQRDESVLVAATAAFVFPPVKFN